MSVRAGVGDRVGGWCFRCGAELAASESETQWCPGCGAPQLTLADSARLVPSEVAARTTGAVPPPRPQWVDWRAMIQMGALVAGLAALLTTFGLLLPPIGALANVLVLLSGFVAASLYRRHRPALPMNARAGTRVGLVAGVLTVAAVATVLVVGATAERFLFHRGAEIDKGVRDLVETAVQSSNSQPGTPLFTPEALALLNTAEGRAGFVLLLAAGQVAFLLALATAGGALAGSLVRRRAHMGRAL